MNTNTTEVACPGCGQEHELISNEQNVAIASYSVPAHNINPHGMPTAYSQATINTPRVGVLARLRSFSESVTKKLDTITTNAGLVINIFTLAVIIIVCVLFSFSSIISYAVAWFFRPLQSYDLNLFIQGIIGIAIGYSMFRALQKMLA